VYSGIILGVLRRYMKTLPAGT